MAGESILQWLTVHDGAGQSDGQLLRRYLVNRDESAFAVLVRRHGRMVLGVCQRVLRNTADSEDAFQAVFLVLAHKARSLRDRGVIGDWLHGVARRTALKARVAAARRRVKELHAAKSEVPSEIKNHERLPRLDDALGRLPEKYRLPIVLCDLEGKTRAEAAAELDWPEGTVAGRLARGRAMLAKRLLRGAQAGVGVVPLALADAAAQAALPASWAARAALSALHALDGSMLCAGEPLPSSLLAKGVMRSMMWQKIKHVAVAFIALAAVVGVGGWTLHLLAIEPQQEIGAPGGLQPVKKVPTERDKALYKAARDQFDVRWQESIAGKTTADFTGPWSALVLKAELRLLDKKAAIVRAHEDHVDRTRALEKLIAAKFEAGAIAPSQYHQTVYYRIEAEIWLEEARAGK